MDLSGWITAGATLILAVITGFYVRLTKQLLDAQTDPYVVVSTIHDSNRPTIIQLVIKNIGSGLARDIKFHCSRPIPTRAWGITIDDAKDAATMEAGPLIEGIPGLAPGEERRIDWGQYGGLMKALGDEPVFITSFFTKNGKDMPSVVSAVDVKSYKDTTAAQSLNAEIASDIRKMSKNIEHLTMGFKKIHIDFTDLEKFYNHNGRE